MHLNNHGEELIGNKFYNDHNVFNVAEYKIAEILDYQKIGYISECNLGGSICMSKKMLSHIANSLGLKETNDNKKNNSEDIHEDISLLADITKKTNCDSELCVAKKFFDHTDIKEIYKAPGKLTVELINDKNIDDKLKYWNKLHPEFFPYNFNMLNFKQHSIKNGKICDEPDTLQTINLEDVYGGGAIYINDIRYENNFRCAGCIINSDKYHGHGKHWMALFVDMRNTNAPFTVEFFNSSGNAPAYEWLEYMEKTKTQLENIIKRIGAKNTAEIIRVSDVRQQQSKTECGMYSLFYIWARIRGIPYKYFAKNSVPDQLMFMARGIFFTDPNFYEKIINKLCDHNHFLKDITAAKLQIAKTYITEKNIFGLLSHPAHKMELIKRILQTKTLAKYFHFDYNLYRQIVAISWE